MEQKEVRVMFIPTKNVFTLPEDEVARLIKEDRGNYKVLDDDFVIEPEKTEQPEPTVLDQVLDGDQNDNPQNEDTEDIIAGDAGVFDKDGNKKTEQPDEELQQFKAMDKDELLLYCIDNEIEVDEELEKEEIIEAILKSKDEE